MKLHIVGGFLGSGKTTSIVQAAKTLMDAGTAVGVITNDQGKFLVDSAFFRLSNVPTVEVTGGCFCCNYDDLDSRLNQLIAASQPDVIFAESVGSCADIVATVLRPLLVFASSTAEPSSFSVFTDARLLRRRLLGQELPFSDDVVYIFDKQIEEAGLVVINKIDLLPPEQVQETEALLRRLYPEKMLIAQSTLAPDGTQGWLEQIQSGALALPGNELLLDYSRYGQGEGLLAWVDQEIALTFPQGSGQAAVRTFIGHLLRILERRGAGIGHLKFVLSAGDRSDKISFPAITETGWEDRVPEIAGSSAALLINARVEIPVGDLLAALRAALDMSGAAYSVTNQDAFHPPQPNPTHRIVN